MPSTPNFSTSWLGLVILHSSPWKSNCGPTLSIPGDRRCDYDSLTMLNQTSFTILVKNNFNVFDIYNWLYNFWIQGKTIIPHDTDTIIHHTDRALQISGCGLFQLWPTDTTARISITPRILRVLSGNGYYRRKKQNREKVNTKRPRVWIGRKERKDGIACFQNGVITHIHPQQTGNYLRPYWFRSEWFCCAIHTGTDNHTAPEQTSLPCRERQWDYRVSSTAVRELKEHRKPAPAVLSPYNLAIILPGWAAKQSCTVRGSKKITWVVPAADICQDLI